MTVHSAEIYPGYGDELTITCAAGCEWSHELQWPDWTPKHVHAAFNRHLSESVVPGPKGKTR